MANFKSVVVLAMLLLLVVIPISAAPSMEGPSSFSGSVGNWVAFFFQWLMGYTVQTSTSEVPVEADGAGPPTTELGGNYIPIG